MSRQAKDMTGQRFDSLVAIEQVGNVSGSALWRFVCDCGLEVCRTRSSVMGTAKKGHKNSCGCAYGRIPMEMHGLKADPLYSVWESMKKRCFNPSSRSYKDYGAKGISVCDEWKRSFLAFKRDMGSRPEGFEIDRIDSSKGYFKDNCRWADRKTQATNKTNTIKVKINGVEYPLTDAIRKFCPKKKYQTIYMRLKVYGFSDHEAIFS